MSSNFTVNFQNQLSVTDDFGYWFSGICDGEGCFCLAIQKQKTSGKGRKLQLLCEFLISLSEIDTNTLRYISKNITGDDRICFKRDKRYKKKRMGTFRVADRTLIRNVIIPLFDKYPLRSSKLEDYKIWREVAIKLCAGEIKSDEDVLNIAKIRDQSNYNKGGSRSRKSYEDLKTFVDQCNIIKQ